MISYTIKYYLNTISPRGRIAWEYNPLHNFRRTKRTDSNGLHEDQVKLYGQLYTLISEDKEKKISRYKDINGNTLSITSRGNVDKVYLNGEQINNDVIFYKSSDNIEAGSIVDLDTELLNFSLNNPVNIDVQPSYDGSVNLILNDDRNPPRLINNRFSVRELNTYEIVDRIGDNDTNIYDDDINQFDLDTSLYKKYNKIPKVVFNRVISGGNLKVGNYVLYFRYCDADENETDFVAESGIIPIFRGNDKDPFSINGGFVDMNAFKSIDVTLTNIDEAYDYIKVYYTRSSSDLDQNRQTTAHKLLKKFTVSRNVSRIILTGDEQEELIPITELTSEYFIAETAKTQAQCQNMLFLGNVSRPDPLHQDLTDLSIRMLPYQNTIKASNLIGRVNIDTYIDNNALENNYEYYNTKNIYYNLGYWNEEIYRIGVVYIMYDNTLSKVYNIRGCERLPSISELKNNYTFLDDSPIFDDEGNRQYIKVSEEDFSIVGGKYLENARGVVRFLDNDKNNGNSQEENEKIYSLGVVIPEDVYSYLKNYCGIKGLFFVRQKRMPTILAQGLTIPIDPEARVPVIYYKEKNNNYYYEESFISQKDKLEPFRIYEREGKELTHDYFERLIKSENISKTKLDNSTVAAILCPEYEIRQQYYNQLFTGTEYPIGYIYGEQSVSKSLKDRFYTMTGHVTTSITDKTDKAKLVSVSEEVPTVAIGDNIFRGVCGVAQEAFRFRYAFKEGSKTKDDTNLLRGIWHPYIGAVFKNKVEYGKLVNIYIPGYNLSELANYYKVRYSDNSPYYPIGDRLGITDITSSPFDTNTGYKLNFYRGDCYLCTFTHRLNRNFNDPAAPANDLIVDKDSWVGFDPEDESTFENVNLGDINAIKIGSWYTFRVRSNTNLSIRSLDESHLEEKGVFGLARGFYPLNQELESGNNKIPDSYNVNDGFRGNFGEKFYLRYPDVPYIKNNFENRILYSDIAINDAYRNGFRVFKSTHFNDYTKEYGSIIKLVTMSSQGLQNGLLCVFEHGIGYIPVNERAVAGEGTGGNVYINTSNVLPDNPRIISDKFGSQWPESVIQTPYGVYGLDTVAKKIWRTNGAQLEVLSDFKVNKFLVDNITLTERELTPIIGVRNVKTHYNANKNDVMFTFYDNQYGIEEKVWNLCYNEINQKFTTFYSWVPSYSENIDNMYFSFDRETSKAISKLGTSQYGSTNADGITLTNAVIEEKNGKLQTIIRGLVNRILPDKVNGVSITYNYEILEDPYGNSKYFRIDDTDKKNVLLVFNRIKDGKEFNEKKVWYVYIKCNINIQYDNNTVSDYEAYRKNWEESNLKYSYGYYTSIVAVTSKDVFENTVVYDVKDDEGNYHQSKAKNCEVLTTDFWKHGQAGIIDIKDDIKPCEWYGKQHPFEFEFLVRDTPNMHKVFENLEIISNKAEPESFHFEIVGEVYDFSEDKRNMYYRQELTKKFWQKNGVNISYDNKFSEIKPHQNIKSTIFPLYYGRIDTYDNVYDSYKKWDGVTGIDYSNLSGSEIVRDKQLNEYRIRVHKECVPIKSNGRLRGNSNYIEDRWKIQIPSITFVQKNEGKWINDKPPIVLNYVPKDYPFNSVQPDKDDIIDTNSWTYRKEAKIKDKYMKVRIRYEGKELAIIQAVITLYTESYG